MRKLSRLSVLIIFSLSILLMIGCGDDSVRPSREYVGLHGVVVDADGLPLPDVAIGVIYTFPEAVVQNSVIVVRPPAKPATMIGFELPEPGEVSIQIFDYAGDWVITLVNSELQAGRYQFIWDGRDDAGNRVASGMYYYHLQFGDEPPEINEMFLLYLDPVAFLLAPNTYKRLF